MGTGSGGRKAAAFLFKRGKNPLAPSVARPHQIAAMINSVQICAISVVSMTTVKRARWHRSAWRRWSCAKHKRHG